MTRSQKENAIAGKLPNDSKRGRGKDRVIFLTGDIAKALNQPSYTTVRLSELSNEDIDTLYGVLVKRKSASLDQDLIRLGSKAPHLQKHLRHLVTAVRRQKLADYASTAKWMRGGPSAEVTVGKFIRVTWRRGALMVEELPGNKKKRLRYFHAEFEWLSRQSDDFIVPNLQRAMKLNKNDTYDAAIRKIENAFTDIATERDETHPDQGAEWVYKHLKMSEDDVWYLHVAPGSADKMSVDGKDFTLTVDWNEFRAASPRSDFQNHDPSYTMVVSKSNTAARKLYRILNNDPNALKSVPFDKLMDWLAKNKVAAEYQFSVWR